MAISADLSQFLDREWEDKSLTEILKAPVSALQGVSEADAEAPEFVKVVGASGSWGFRRRFLGLVG
jgi:hypothetical protein